MIAAARRAAAVAWAFAALGAAAPCAADDELPPGPGRELVYGQCRTCHDLQYVIESAGVPRATWSDLLDSMRQYGLRLGDDQRTKILDYLSTYLGPKPAPTASVAAPAPAKTAAADGAAVFRDQCAVCHQPDGRGVAGQFPPLAGNSDLFLSRDFPARVVLFGLSGKIQAGDRAFDGAMPPLGLLGDAEIAAVVRYVRHAWGNDRLRPTGMELLDDGTVAKLRADGGSPQQVHAARADLAKAGAQRR